MIDRNNINERKETTFARTPCGDPVVNRYETTTNRYDTTTPRYDTTTNRYDNSKTRYNTLTEKRSDSVLKGVIALLSFLALLWLAYAIISSVNHHEAYKLPQEAPITAPDLNEKVAPVYAPVVKTAPATEVAR